MLVIHTGERYLLIKILERKHESCHLKIEYKYITEIILLLCLSGLSSALQNPSQSVSLSTPARAVQPQNSLIIIITSKDSLLQKARRVFSLQCDFYSPTLTMSKIS